MELKFCIGDEVFVIKSGRDSLLIRKAKVRSITINDRGIRYQLAGGRAVYNEKEEDVYSITSQTQALYDGILSTIRMQNPNEDPENRHFGPDEDVSEDENEFDESPSVRRPKIAAKSRNY